MDTSSIWLVSKLGNDANSGHASTYPINLANDSKLTIGAAVPLAASGDTILIWPGDYAESVDLLTAAKTINLIGTNKRKCRIVPTTGSGIKGYGAQIITNLSVEPAGGSPDKGIDLYGQNDAKIINCYVSVLNGIDAIYAATAKRILIDNCYAICGWDSVSIGEDSIVKDSTIITTGLYAGSPGYTTRALFYQASTSNVSTYLMVDNCTIMANPSFETLLGKTPTLYQSQANLYAIEALLGNLNIRNSLIMADGSKPTGANANSYSKGNAYALYGISRVQALNCSIIAKTDQNWSYSAYALKSINTSAHLLNCGIETSGITETYDLDTVTLARLGNCQFLRSKCRNSVIKQIPTDIPIGMSL